MAQMYKNIPYKWLEESVISINLHGGSAPFNHDSYLSLARPIKTYPKGTKVKTPDGIQDLVVAVEVEIEKWLNGPMKYNGVSLSRFGNPEAIRLFKQANKNSKPLIVPFYLTDSGKIYYTTNGVQTSHLSIPEKEISEAEEILQNIWVVGYTPAGFIKHILGGEIKDTTLMSTTEFPVQTGKPTILNDLMPNIN